MTNAPLPAMADTTLTVLYFAWLRERVGRAEEQINPPADIATVAALIVWLSGQSAGHAAAFAHSATVRCAVNQEFVEPSAPVKRGDEVAFFPPVTGG